MVGFKSWYNGTRYRKTRESKINTKRYVVERSVGPYVEKVHGENKIKEIRILYDVTVQI